MDCFSLMLFADFMSSLARASRNSCVDCATISAAASASLCAGGSRGGDCEEEGTLAASYACSAEKCSTIAFTSKLKHLHLFACQGPTQLCVSRSHLVMCSCLPIDLFACLSSMHIHDLSLAPLYGAIAVTVEFRLHTIALQGHISI